MGVGDALFVRVPSEHHLIKYKTEYIMGIDLG